MYYANNSFRFSVVTLFLDNQSFGPCRLLMVESNYLSITSLFLRVYPSLFQISLCKTEP